MAFISGVATGPSGILSEIISFCSENGFDILSYGTDSVYLESKGRSGLDAIRVGIEKTDGAPNLALFGSIGYCDGRGNGKHPGSSQMWYVYLAEDECTYYLTVNKQRILFSIKVGDAWQMGHLGFSNPPASTNQYPYPMVIAGCGYDKDLIISSNYAEGIAMFWSGDSITKTGQVFGPGGGWYDIINASPTGAERHCTMIGTSDGLRSDMLTCEDGSYLTDQCFFIDKSRPNNFGQIEGLRRISGDGLQPGKIITINYEDWICVPNVLNDTKSDFAIMRLA